MTIHRNLTIGNVHRWNAPVWYISFGIGRNFYLRGLFRNSSGFRVVGRFGYLSINRVL